MTIARDVPLVKQVEGSLSEVTGDYRTLESDEVDKVKAKAELIASPIFKELIISASAKGDRLRKFSSTETRIKPRLANNSPR